jgi:xanthine dehydrogenase accessory factor
VDGSLQPLLPLYAEACAAGTPLVLATVVATRGSTYRKAGAQMLIAPDGRYAGLLSGGCLESDLVEHAKGVCGTGVPKLVSYDNSGEDDSLWGLGAGCDGGMDIWLMRLDPADSWAPFGALATAFDQGVPVTYALVLASTVPAMPAGRAVWSPNGAAQIERPGALPSSLAKWLERHLSSDASVVADTRIVESDEPRVRLFVSRAVPPRELLLLGAGPDAVPVVEFAASLGWRVTVADHRPAYAAEVKFPRARRVVLSTPKELPQHLNLAAFDAAVIMTHHFATDLAALTSLASSSIPYVGLLGPAARRKQLLTDMGPTASASYGARLHAPVGLDLGGRDPASIALAIVAEIQAFFHGKGRAVPPRHAPVV